MTESSHDLVAANEARVREILRIVGGGDEPEAEAGCKPRVLDHRCVRGTWSAWDS